MDLTLLACSMDRRRGGACWSAWSARVRGRLTPTWMRRINVASGALMGVFALVALANAALATTA